MMKNKGSNGIALDPRIIHAASMDAGNASMRAAGRNKWSKADRNAAHREHARLCALVSDARLIEWGWK